MTISNRPIMFAYVDNWHIKRSPAFEMILQQPLADVIDIQFIATSEYDASRQSVPVIFCQYIPLDLLPAHPQHPIFWLPMWDSLDEHSQAWWKHIPDYVQVIAYSQAVAERAQAAGLRVLALQYYPNPDDFAPVDWNAPRTLFYWNRKRLIDAAGLWAICNALAIERVIFRPQVDARMPAEAHYLPTIPSGSRIKLDIAQNVDSYVDYMALLRQAHFFIAPRDKEGVGIAFLEAMAQGSAVLAVDNPTMSEVIMHGETGFLLPTSPNEVAHNLIAFEQYNRLRQSRWRWLRVAWLIAQGKRKHYRTLLPVERLPLTELKAQDWQRIGEHARMAHIAGHTQFKARVPDLVAFLLGHVST